MRRHNARKFHKPGTAYRPRFMITIDTFNSLFEPQSNSCMTGRATPETSAPACSRPPGAERAIMSGGAAGEDDWRGCGKEFITKVYEIFARSAKYD